MITTSTAAPYLYTSSRTDDVRIPCPDCKGTGSKVPAFANILISRTLAGGFGYWKDACPRCKGARLIQKQ